jgi:hypothetical protein
VAFLEVVHRSLCRAYTYSWVLNLRHGTKKGKGGCFYIRGEYSYLTNLMGGTPESIAILRVRSLA